MSPRYKEGSFTTPLNIEKPILSNLDLSTGRYCVNYLFPNETGLGFGATSLLVGKNSEDPFTALFLERDYLGVPTKAEVFPTRGVEPDLVRKDYGILIEIARIGEGKTALRAEDQYGRKQDGFCSVEVWDDQESRFINISSGEIDGKRWEQAGQAYLEREYRGGLLIVPRFETTRSVFVLPIQEALDSKSKAIGLYRLRLGLS